MDDTARAKYRVEALNLAYGILIQQFQAKLGTPAGNNALTNPIPTTEKVLAEAQKLTEFIETP